MPHFNNLAVFFNIFKKKTSRLVKWGIPNSLIDQLLCITPKKSIAAQSFPRWQATVVLKRSSDFLEAILSMYFSFSDFFFRCASISWIHVGESVSD